MEVNSATTAAAASAGARNSDSARQIASDFDTFLQLLTTQMRNQDPLNPTDSTEFVAQLANFSGVEQQVKTNEQLESIRSMLAASASGAVQWIGKEVQAPTFARFDGAPIEVAFDAGAPAQSAQMVVYDESDREVARMAVDPASSTVIWDGTIDGQPAPEGLYRFEQLRSGEDGLERAEPGRVFALVQEVRLSGGEALLVLENGRTVSEAEVAAVRAPS
ncbi:flagellar hook capping FlgD N-terminal domain-containing protein [Oceanicella actignis]|uniref:Basal-body rod modification protein FlgD n=1 Tax=Oceanicella actignis TaxID=1189325 RepID=A0A1M7TC25_9RHOB|nr:flagellar hook capping FlgD N-terminal domain-containing protein [Oceanicella actignis]SET54569.1 flagellar basal-body rod modification protein FlgD [Oceanicella actignis]SHN68236.1 flagellar basal-body rod modification protein FlgD [Oceanicella actignis]